MASGDAAEKYQFLPPSQGSPDSLESSAGSTHLRVADSCVEDRLVGSSKISGDPTVREAYQRKSRWVLAAGVPAPQAEEAGSRPSAFIASSWISCATSSLPILRLHLARRWPSGSARSRPGPEKRPITGLGDDDGQFVFRLEGRTRRRRDSCPRERDPRIATLRHTSKPANPSVFRRISSARFWRICRGRWMHCRKRFRVTAASRRRPA